MVGAYGLRPYVPPLAPPPKGEENKRGAANGYKKIVLLITIAKTVPVSKFVI